MPNKKLTRELNELWEHMVKVQERCADDRDNEKDVVEKALLKSIARELDKSLDRLSHLNNINSKWALSIKARGQSAAEKDSATTDTK